MRIPAAKCHRVIAFFRANNHDYLSYIFARLDNNWRYPAKDRENARLAMAHLAKGWRFDMRNTREARKLRKARMRAHLRAKS